MSTSGQGGVVVPAQEEMLAHSSTMKPNSSEKSSPSHGSGSAETATHDEGSTSGDSSQSENEYRPKRSRNELRLSEEEYVMVAKDIMGKPPFSGYLKYHLPLRYAARCEEVRWQWEDQQTGKLFFKELIGGGRNSDLEYD